MQSFVPQCVNASGWAFHRSGVGGVVVVVVGGGGVCVCVCVWGGGGGGGGNPKC